MIGQSGDAALAVTIMLAIECGARDPELVQRALGRRCDCSTKWMNLGLL